ncbi:MAG: helix-turn-helix domain-containing protein [Oscillospiraceae bacterium]|nr:helix-turn-helix domain-containing protein [Oscillospiraceae bacterium]
MNIKIGAKIKALRKRDDITQERLAEVLGVTSQAISKWESENGYPDIENISPLANFFNVTTDYLFDHDTAEKRRKIDEYCTKCDAHRMEVKPIQELIDMMRQALAEFPAEEKLLFRLAEALYQKISGHGYYHTDVIDGKYFIHDYEKHKSFGTWEEAVKIFEELLATSLDDSIRNECRVLLSQIYSYIGEKEKVLEIAEKCGEIYQSKERILTTLDGKDEEIYKQKFVLSLILNLHEPFLSLLWFIRDGNVSDEAYNIMINLYKFIFSDGNYGGYNIDLQRLYQRYASFLAGHNKFDEAFRALENAYNHAKMFEIYIPELREKSEIKFTAPYVNTITEYSKDYGTFTQMADLLRDLKDEEDIFLKKLRDDPRYTALINKIEAYLSSN